jgi:hypothetical protein
MRRDGHLCVYTRVVKHWSAYSAQSERGFHAIVNARCVSGPRTPIWDPVFTMISVTDGFQLCRARIRSRRGMSVSRASLPAEPGA